MNFLFPILAAVLQAGSFTLDKAVLSIRRVDFRAYTGVSFPLIFVITLIIFFIFRPPLSLDLFSGTLLWLILLSILFTIVTNFIFYRALDADRLSEIETIGLLREIPLILTASFIFASERNVAIIAAALVASVAIIWSHWERHHFRIARETLPFLLWTIAIAPFGAIIARQLLEVWHPITLEMVRAGAVALILGPVFFRKAGNIPLKAFHLLIATNILTSVAWILYYTSYQRSGIIYTVLLFSIQPLLVYFSSVFFLKEPFQRKKFIAFLVVLGAIVVAQLAHG